MIRIGKTLSRKVIEQQVEMLGNLCSPREFVDALLADPKTFSVLCCFTPVLNIPNCTVTYSGATQWCIV
jgi:hypothetical protein